MAKFIGRTVDFGIAKEATRGTAESTAGYFIPKVSLSMDDVIEQVVDEANLGVIEDSLNADTVKKISVGELEANIRSKSIGLIFLSLFGSVSTSGPTDSAYTHTFSVLQSAQHPSLTLFYEDGNQDYRHALGMITDAQIDVVLGVHARISVGFRAKAGASATNTASYVAESQFLPQHGTFKIATTQAGLGAASAFNIRKLSLSIEKNVEDDMAIGSLAPVDILNKHFAVTGEVEVVFNDETFKTDMLADTVKAMRIQLINTDVLIGTTSRPTITIDLHAYKVTSFTRNLNNNDVVTATIAFKAFYKQADSKMLTVSVINDVASY